MYDVKSQILAKALEEKQSNITPTERRRLSLAGGKLYTAKN